MPDLESKDVAVLLFISSAALFVVFIIGLALVQQLNRKPNWPRPRPQTQKPKVLPSPTLGHKPDTASSTLDSTRWDWSNYRV